MDLTVFPHNGVFQLLDPRLEVDWALESTANTTFEGYGVQLAGNGFAAFTDIEDVLTGMAAVLELAEAEVLGVGGGWVHMAMIYWVLGYRFVTYRACGAGLSLNPLTLSRLGTGAVCGVIKGAVALLVR